jgi:hypothetical protein
MFEIKEDLSIHLTRGDACTINVSATNGGEAYTFVDGDVVRLTVTKAKDCGNVLMTKDVRVSGNKTSAALALTGDDTKFGEVINKPTDYWYEVELNPDTLPQTIIGYDESGAKIFRLYPEGGGEV